MKKLNVIQLLSVLLITLIIVSDFATRIWIKPDYSTKQSEFGDLDSIKRPQLNQKQLAVLDDLYSQFLQSSNKENDDANNLSEFGDKVATKDPSEILLNGHLLELKAIVAIADSKGRKDQFYCLIKDNNLQTNESVVVKLNNKQIFHGHLIEIIDSTQVKMFPVEDSSVKSETRAELVLAMYQRKNDNSLSGQ